MTEAIHNKNLIERFGRFTDYRKRVEKNDLSFTEQLDLKAADAPPEQQRSVERPIARSARRSQPPVRLGRAKAITSLQAQRLARLAPAIEGAAARHGVPVELICGVILQESGANPRAVSSAGARGLMQLMPGTARRFGVTNSFDPIQNIEGGTRYLRFLLEKFKGNFALALAGYNAGEGNVEKYGNKVPPFAETQAYVPNVLGYTQTMVDIFFLKFQQDYSVIAKRA